MLYTNNYNLNLPEKNEQFNIEHFNDNSRAIDEQLKINSDDIDTVNERLLEEIKNRESANDTLQESIDDKLDKTLNGAEGILPVANGGTGQTTLPDIFKSIVRSLSGHSSKTLVDNDKFLMSTEDHEESGDWGRIHLSQIWTYIQSKISNVLGLTKLSYNGEASTATALTTSAGSVTMPVYFKNGKPVVCTSNQLQDTRMQKLTNSKTWKIVLKRPHGTAGGFISYGYSDVGNDCVFNKINIRISSTTATYEVVEGRDFVDSITCTLDGVNVTVGIKLKYIAYGTSEIHVPSAFAELVDFTTDDFTGKTVATEQRAVDTVITKGSDLVPTSNAVYEAIKGDYDKFVYTCNTSPTNVNKIVNVPTFNLIAGVRITVIFINGHAMNGGSLTLNVNNTGAKPIKVLIPNYGYADLSITQFYGGISIENSTFKHYFCQLWDKYTTLEMYYDEDVGTDGSWVVIGNPVVHRELKTFTGVQNLHIRSVDTKIYINGYKEYQILTHLTKSTIENKPINITFNSALNITYGNGITKIKPTLSHALTYDGEEFGHQASSVIIDSVKYNSTQIIGMDLWFSRSNSAAQGIAQIDITGY